MNYEQKKWIASREAIRAAKEKRKQDNALNKEIVRLGFEIERLKQEKQDYATRIKGND